MRRRFTQHEDGKKVIWRVFSDEGALLDARIAPDERKAWCESAHSMKLLAKGKHVRSKGKKHK